MPKELSVQSLVHSAGRRLQGVGIESGVEEAEIVLCYLLDIERIDLYLAGSQCLTSEVVDRFEEIISRRETRYPLQYILGESWFYGRRFAVNPSVMVPTPETELLCEVGLGFLRYLSAATPQVLDVGAGSGVIAVTIACEAPESRITALDISPAALAVARANAVAHNVDSRIDFRTSDIFSGLIATEKFDLILSNPPYIMDGEYDTLPPEVLADPRLALTSGPEGMDVINRLIADAPRYLAPGGKLMFEIGYNQVEMVTRQAASLGQYRSHVVMRDLNDIDRVVILSL